MNNTVKYTSEYVYNSNKLDQTRKIIEKTLHEYEQKDGANYPRILKIICVAEFLDRLKNETKIITIENYNIVGELKKIMQSSEGLCKLIRIIEIKIIINGVN